jgi:hypothetical protein
LVVIGFMLALAGAMPLYSNTKHQMNGRAATATLIARVKQCTVAYQRIGEEKRKEKWPCALAEEFQRRVGPNKVEISHDFIARVRFTLEDGHPHEADVDEVQLGSFPLAIGATLPVFYAPDKPEDVRAEISWEQVKIELGLLAVGIVFLALALAGPLATLYGWASRGRTSRAWEEMMSTPSEHPAPSGLEDSSTSQRRPSTMGQTPRPSFGIRNR